MAPGCDALAWGAWPGTGHQDSSSAPSASGTEGRGTVVEIAARMSLAQPQRRRLCGASWDA